MGECSLAIPADELDVDEVRVGAAGGEVRGVREGVLETQVAGHGAGERMKRGETGNAWMNGRIWRKCGGFRFERIRKFELAREING